MYTEKINKSRNHENQFLLYLQPQTGALAQLARVSDWQSEGHGFDSRTLHERKVRFLSGFFYFLLEIYD